MLGSEGGPRLWLQRGPRWPGMSFSVGWVVVQARLGPGRPFSVTSSLSFSLSPLIIQTTGCWGFSAQSGLSSPLSVFFALMSPFPMGSMSFCAGIAAPGLRCFPRVFSVVSRANSQLWFMGFSLQWLLLLWSMGSRLVGFSSCGPQAQLPHGIRNLPGPPDIKHTSSVLAGEFFSTGPPGNSSAIFFFWKIVSFFFFFN